MYIAAEGQVVAIMVSDTFSGLSNDESFHMFWTKLVRMAKSFRNLDRPTSPSNQDSTTIDGVAISHFHHALPVVYY